MDFPFLENSIETLSIRLNIETRACNKAIDEHQKFKDVSSLYKISQATNKELKAATIQLENLLNREMESFDRHK